MNTSNQQFKEVRFCKVTGISNLSSSRFDVTVQSLTNQDKISDCAPAKPSTWPEFHFRPSTWFFQEESNWCQKLESKSNSNTQFDHHLSVLFTSLLFVLLPECRHAFLLVWRRGSTMAADLHVTFAYFCSFAYDLCISLPLYLS